MRSLFSGLPALWWVKITLSALAVVFGVFFTLPTFLGDPDHWPRETSAGGAPPGRPLSWVHRAAERLLPASRVALGLDLKGGLHLVLEVEADASMVDVLGRAALRAKDNAKAKGAEFERIDVGQDFSLTAVVKEESQVDAAKAVVASETTLVSFSKADGKTLVFLPVPVKLADYRDNLLKQAINTIRNRIDQFGVAEPNIFQQGERRIVVQLPGTQDPERAKALLGNTAHLDFRRVLGNLSEDELDKAVGEARKGLGLPEEDVETGTTKQIAQWLQEHSKIPAESTVLFERKYEDAPSKKLLYARPYLVEAQARLTGDMLETVEAGTMMSNGFVPEEGVSIAFNPQGSKLFGMLTKEAADPANSPHLIAIVLDDNVNSAPRVQGPILDGHARITLGRSLHAEAKQREAKDLALVLRAGALPAKVKVVEERLVGPSAGEENIRAGLLSSIVAGVVVIALMLVIYGTSGLVANFAMLLNVLLILALLAAFGATLTLPGIAGIVLTMAVAVDGNVIINERIREELRSGHSMITAFRRGYDASLVTLVDAHVTSAVAGLVLLAYGNPSVKGFAVTLLTGIVSTLFTSYTVTEVIGEWLLRKTNMKRFA